MSESDPGAAPSRSVASLLARWFEQRDRGALEELLRGVLPALDAYAHRKLGGALRAREETGDVIQEAVVDFLRYAPSFRVETEGQLRAILYRIVDAVVAGQHQWFSRMCRDFARERPLPEGTSVVFGRELVSREPSPTAEARAAERDAAVRLALLSLEPTDQKIVMLRNQQGRTFAAIGHEVAMSEDAVRKRFDRAMQRLSRKVMAWRQGSFDEFWA